MPQPSDIPVVIMCGGLGTRLREATENVPKPLVDIGGRPILWHVMKVYARHGFRRFVLCLGYRAWDIKEYFLRYRENMADFTLQLSEEGEPTYHNDLGLEDWEVTLAETGMLTGTGGRLARVSTYLQDSEHFAITYADGLSDVDLTAELRFHLDGDAMGTVLGVRPTGRYGELQVVGDRVEAFDARPSFTDGYVSGGFFFFRRDLLDHLEPDDSHFLEIGPMRQLALDGNLRVFKHEGFWVGMDTYREYTELNRLWDEGKAPWRTWDD